ncbi:hypothetical protein P3S67_013875 [Capsicum chacoense]
MMNIRVFKWKHEIMLSRVYSDYQQFGFSSPEYGFLVIQFKNMNMNTVVVQPFLLVNEESQIHYQVDLLKSIGNALMLSNLFKFETIHPLSNTISAYLKSCFGKTTFYSGIHPDDIKIVVVVDVDMDVSQPPNKDGNNVYDILWNGNESSSDDEKIYEYGVQKCDNKRRRSPYSDGYDYFQERDLARLDVEFVVENSDIQDIVNSICNYMIEEARFVYGVDPFDGVKQEFGELIGGLKIMTVGKVILKKNIIVHNFELGEDDIWPICFEKFSEESMVAVTTPCSHIFHRSCVFSWL